MKATTGFFHDRRREKNDGTFPVKLRITYRRKYKLYNTNVSLSKEDFQKVMGKSPRGVLKDYRFELNYIEAKASAVLKKLEVFTFDGFEKHFLQKDFDILNIFEGYEKKMNELKRAERFGTLDTYRCSLNSIIEFHQSKTLYLNEVTIKFLNDYEKWMLASNRSLTTVGIYLRNLRAVYNLTIEENQLINIDSPFGKKRYKIPAPQNIKKSLSIRELKLLYDYKPVEGSTEQKYRDIWFFSYLCNGMNIKDICLLQHNNIQGDHIYFYRKKTINSIRNSKPIDVVIIDEIRAILTRWATPNDNPDNYVFPFITHDMEAQKIMATVKQVTKMTNKYIRIIASKVGIDKPISTYWARHSFATVLMRSNVGTEFIREQLGHKSLSTTENYLGSFEDDAKREIANKLLEF